ncbi:hypothetical protein EV122DRAFT_256049 [Schizophyllum commune]
MAGPVRTKGCVTINGIDFVNHVCVVCNMIFRDKRGKDRHSTTHLSEDDPRKKPFPCEYCGKRFSQKTGMQIHAKRHVLVLTYHSSTGVKDLICDADNCNFATHDPSLLNKHRRVIHNIAPERRPKRQPKRPKAELSKEAPQSPSDLGRSSPRPLSPANAAPYPSQNYYDPPTQEFCQTVTNAHVPAATSAAPVPSSSSATSISTSSFDQLDRILAPAASAKRNATDPLLTTAVSSNYTQVTLPPQGGGESDVYDMATVLSASATSNYVDASNDIGLFDATWWYSWSDPQQDIDLSHFTQPPIEGQCTNYPYYPSTNSGEVSSGSTLPLPNYAHIDGTNTLYGNPLYAPALRITDWVH